MRRVAERLGLAAKPRVKSAELIAPFGEFAAALRHATPQERAILRAGWRSRSELDQLAAAVSARLILARQMNVFELRRYLQHLQGRYLAAVGPAAFAHYERAVPEDVLTNEQALRAEVETISHRLRLAYAISHVRDRHVARVRKGCFYGLLLATALLIAILVCEQVVLDHSLFILNYAMIALAGFGGALTSIARRASTQVSAGKFAEDPVIQASAFQDGRGSLWLAALTGPVFAVVMLFVLMSGVLALDGVTPSFESLDCGRFCGAPDFQIFGRGYDLTTSLDGVKLFLLAFVAGFAEKLVPDVLDRFAQPPERKAAAPQGAS